MKKKKKDLSNVKEYALMVENYAIMVNQFAQFFKSTNEEPETIKSIRQCGYRDCNNTLDHMKDTALYCCDKHRKKEWKLKNYESKQNLN